MRGKRKGRADRPGGVFDQRIGRVHVKLKGIGDIRGDAASRKPADVGQRVLKAGEIVQIGQRRRPVAAGLKIKRLHRRTSGSKVNRIAADLNCTARIASVKIKSLWCRADRRFDQLVRQQNAAIGLLGTICKH